MRFAFVGTRNGKPTLNWIFVFAAVLLLVAVCTGITLLLGAAVSDAPLVNAIGWVISTLIPITIVMASVLRGLNTPPDQLPKLD